ncbi:MAG: hypothetical protein RBR97_11005 [Bacteroidales bacterium]|nr:hypothetical protein [Bacteroidales bacterium]
MKKIIILFVCLVILALDANAKYTQTCKAKYKRNYDWSEYYTLDITFMSGSELNKATKTYKYESYSTYAIIFWDKDEATIIKITSYTGCGTEVKQNCITNKVSNLIGEDQQGRSWEICTRTYCY